MTHHKLTRSFLTGIFAAMLGGMLLGACAGGPVSFKARPNPPTKSAWFCTLPDLAGPGSRSICEPSANLCANTRHLVETRVMRFGSHKGRLSDCAARREAYCYTGLLNPDNSEGSGMPSIHAESEGTWWYDCFAVQSECEADRVNRTDERLRDEKPLDDISPCERWE